MAKYTDIDLIWHEVGLAFQVQFVKKKNTIGGDVGGNGGDGWIENRIKELMIRNKFITASEIANSVNISKRNCERIIAELKKRGDIERFGAARTGHWVVNK